MTQRCANTIYNGREFHFSKVVGYKDRMIHDTIVKLSFESNCLWHQIVFSKDHCHSLVIFLGYHILPIFLHLMVSVPSL